ncbi:MAG: phosphoadenosine phosphosulfate reductase, partial [Bacteroidetes bacterium]
MENKFLAFSGGIDSTALALIEKDATPIFTDTGWEFPEVYQHIKKFEEKTGRKVIRLKSHEGTLPEYILKHKFLPGHSARYCTKIFKILPLN